MQPPAGDDLEGGRGIALLEVLASSWGVGLRRPTGKTHLVPVHGRGEPTVKRIGQ
jgi:hypothetical protein